jgi:hypothetical protein
MVLMSAAARVPPRASESVLRWGHQTELPRDCAKAVSKVACLDAEMGPKKGSLKVFLRV